MSGHSKWDTIHRQKEVTDQKKGQAFTKVSLAITLAVKEGGMITDPNSNFKLRLAMEKAREVNMPKDKVQKAIDRASGKGEGGEISEIIYEGYAPGGVGILVQTATDNRQRTVQEIKNVFDKNGGSVASPGAVAYNFVKNAQFSVAPKGDIDSAVLEMIDQGAEDVEVEGGELVVWVKADVAEIVKDKILAAGYQVTNIEIVEKPVNMIMLTDKKLAGQVIRLIDKLEELEDVQKVFANFDIPEGLLDRE